MRRRKNEKKDPVENEKLVKTWINQGVIYYNDTIY